MIIKVCGLREPENIRDVASLDVNWIGLIYYHKSPRKIKENPFLLPDNSTFQIQPKKVGVFVNSTFEEMMEMKETFRLDYLQLHGNESPQLCHSLQKRGISLIKAFAITSQKDIEQTKDYEGRVNYFLFDTKSECYGGSGKQFDWSVLSAYKGPTPFLLSGGINPDSVSAIKDFHHSRFAGIDLNSGFETEPGIKNIQKLSAFIEQLKTK